MKTLTASDLMSRSVSRDMIVFHPWSADIAAALKIECDYSAKVGNCVEFEGRDEEGDEWRVRLEVAKS